MAKSKSYGKLETIVKGFANRRRLEILDLLKREPELSVDEIAEKLNLGYMNASDHIRKMTIAGLILKRRAGLSVCHKLTDRAEAILGFCKNLE